VKRVVGRGEIRRNGRVPMSGVAPSTEKETHVERRWSNEIYITLLCQFNYKIYVI
jgi:hypothetical protein